MIQELTQQIESGQSLSEEQMADVIDEIMQGKVKDRPIEQFLTALHEKGESVDELVGTAQALRKHPTVRLRNITCL